MVNYNPKVWLDLIFHSYGKQVMKTLLPALIFMGAFTSVICYIFLEHIEPNNFPSSTSAHSLLGIVLGLFLVFRTNTAYDRWWEGRRLWGQLVNDLRNLSIKVRCLAKVSDEEAHRFGRLLVNFARALKEHLREGIRPKQLSVYRDVRSEPKHVPAN